MSQQLLRPSVGSTLGGEGSWPFTQSQNLSPRYSNPLGRAILTDPGRFCAPESHRAVLAPSLGVFSPCRDAVGAPAQGVGCRFWGRPILSLFHCICLPQAGSAGDNGQVDTTAGFVPPASSCGQTGLQGQATAATTHPPPPLPQASLLFQPCHQFSAVVLPTPSSSSSSSQRPGAARTKQDQLPYSSASGKSLPITVPTCPSLSLWPHLSPALLLTNQLFIARRVPLGPSFLHLGEAAARPFSLLDPHCSSPTRASPGLCEGLQAG